MWCVIEYDDFKRYGKFEDVNFYWYLILMLVSNLGEVIYYDDDIYYDMCYCVLKV